VLDEHDGCVLPLLERLDAFTDSLRCDPGCEVARLSLLPDLDVDVFAACLARRIEGQEEEVNRERRNVRTADQRSAQNRPSWSA
jgi:hypothetical protein